MDEASDGQENPAGTIIRCYENLCVSDLGDRGSVYARADLQLSEAVRRPKFMTAGFFRFVQLAEVGKSLKNDVDCMLLTIAGCKAFACKDVVIHRYDRPAAVAKQAAQGCDGSGFAVCVRVEPSKIGARSWILFQRKAAPPSRRLLSRSLMLHKPCISFSMEQ